jgi:hypothetical protein
MVIHEKWLSVGEVSSRVMWVIELGENNEMKIKYEIWKKENWKKEIEIGKWKMDIENGIW